MNAALGEAKSYDDLQPILRARADALGLSRVELDRIAGVPSGYSAKVLAEVPIRKLGPDTLGPMLGALGVKIMLVEDPEALAKFTAKGDARDERYAKNAALHSDSVEIKFGGRKFKRMQRKGGANSRKYMSKKKATRLARRANRMRWHKPKLIELKGSDVATPQGDSHAMENSTCPASN